MKSVKKIKKSEWLIVGFWIVLTVLSFVWHQNTIKSHEEKLAQYQLLIEKSEITVPQLDENLVSVSFEDNVVGRMINYKFSVNSNEYKGFLGQMSDDFTDVVDFTKVHYLSTNPEINAINPQHKLAHIKNQHPTNIRKYLFYGIAIFTILTILGLFFNKEDNTDTP